MRISHLANYTHVFETAAEGLEQTKITVDSIILNPELDDSLFVKPQ